MTLDEMVCSACGQGCVSWAVGEGPRCLAHSGYVGPLADAAGRAGNVRQAQRYVAALAAGGPDSPTAREWMAAYVGRWLQECDPVAGAVSGYDPGGSGLPQPPPEGTP